MKIAIIGTRGIPNHYGGFEQYAELLSVYLVQQGWNVTVYNSSTHPYKKNTFKGVRIKIKYDPEHRLGTIGQFIYDFNCIMDLRREKYNIIYQLGYTSSAIFNFLFPKKSILVTNMDGLEWKRLKYNKWVQRFLKYSEALAVKRSDYLIADALPIKDYLQAQYKADAFYSAYTAEVPLLFNENLLKQYGLIKQAYTLLIARMEPENNIEAIIQGCIKGNNKIPLVIIGSTHTRFGKYLSTKYTSESILFLQSVYDKDILNTLRKYAALYFHGHSVGGTNPSLLEAMACGCSIVAHDNLFNRSVLGNNAVYFSNSKDISGIINNINTYRDLFTQAVVANFDKIRSDYSEDVVFGKLERKMKVWSKK